MASRTRSLAAAVLGFSLLAAPAVAKPPVDIFVREAALKPDDHEGRLIVDATFGRPGATDRLRAALAKQPSKDFETEGWPLLCGDSYHTGAYKRAVADCTKAAALDPDNKDTLALVQTLKDVAATELKGSGARLPIDAGAHISVMAGDNPVVAIADTGAQISVMMESVAAKSGVRIIGKSGSVGTTTTSVSGGTGVIPRVVIGKAVLTNLPVLVLPDEQLTLDEGRIKLPFILSLYGLAKFERIAWLDRGKTLALGDQAPKLGPNAVPVFWHASGVGIPLDGAGGRRGAHYDTGANVSFFYEPGVSLTSAQDQAGLIVTKRKIGGVGGIVEQDVRRFPTVTVGVAGLTLKLKDIDVAAASDTGDAARIGSDIFAQAGTVVLDFKTMRLSARP